MPESNTRNSPPPDPCYRIEVIDHTERCAATAGIRDAIQSTLKLFGIVRGDVSVAVISDSEIQRVNREFLQHDWPTDVITFPAEDPLGESTETDDNDDNGQPVTAFGELLVSLDTAIREATARNVPVEEELALYAIHGTLHLLGFDDHDPADATAMRDAELRAMRTAGYSLATSCEGDDPGRFFQQS